jgi:predicted peptidase
MTGLPFTSPSVTVQNTPPTATVGITGSFRAGQTLTATATKADVDTADTVKLTYVWTVNGVTVRTTSLSTSLTDGYVLPSTIKKTDVVAVTVTPNDGTANGATATANAT